MGDSGPDEEDQPRSSRLPVIA